MKSFEEIEFLSTIFCEEYKHYFKKFDTDSFDDIDIKDDKSTLIDIYTYNPYVTELRFYYDCDGIPPSSFCNDTYAGVYIHPESSKIHIHYYSDESDGQWTKTDYLEFINIDSPELYFQYSTVLDHTQLHLMTLISLIKNELHDECMFSSPYIKCLYDE